jgi:hypothetical protein
MAWGLLSLLGVDVLCLGVMNLLASWMFGGWRFLSCFVCWMFAGKELLNVFAGWQITLHDT